MNAFGKFKEMAKKTVNAVENGITILKEDGLEKTSYNLGNKLGQVAKELKEDVSTYSDEIQKSNKKVTNPVSISFKKGTVSHTTAKTVLSAINTIRIVGTDAKNKTNELLDKVHKPSEPK